MSWKPWRDYHHHFDNNLTKLNEGNSKVITDFVWQNQNRVALKWDLKSNLEAIYPSTPTSLKAVLFYFNHPVILWNFLSYMFLIPALIYTLFEIDIYGTSVPFVNCYGTDKW